MDRRNFVKTGMTSSLALGLGGNVLGNSEKLNEPELPDNQEWETLFLADLERRWPFKIKKAIKRPHVFLITADMISPDSYLMSREIASHVNLKNIRSIGEEGTRFDNAFCSSPLCGPARASLFTGKYPPYLTNGERAPNGMKRNLTEEDVIFQEYVRKSGYNTKHIGKCHVGAEKFFKAFGENDAAWDRWAPPLLDDDQYVAFLDNKGVQPFKYKKELRGKQQDRKSHGNSFGGWIEQNNGEPFPIEAHYSSYLADKAINKLNAALKQAHDSPVYLQLDFFDPHQPFSIPAGLENRERELRNNVKLPESYNQVAISDFKPIKDEPAIYDVYRRYWGAYDPKLVEDYIVAHFLQMEVVDYAVGKLLTEIKRLGLWENSLIIFTGDHGEINGRLGLFDKGVYFQPDIFRVPLYIKCPDYVNQKNGVYEMPVSSLDISKTILGFTGIEPFDILDGEDLGPVLTGKGERKKQECLFQTGWHVGVNYGVGFQVYDDKEHHWFYGYNINGGEQELYNMVNEDGTNLINDKKYEDVKIKIIRRVGKILASDNRWIGYWATFRLHNAEYLPVSGDDMQMFKPK